MLYIKNAWGVWGTIAILLQILLEPVHLLAIHKSQLHPHVILKTQVHHLPAVLRGYNLRYLLRVTVYLHYHLLRKKKHLSLLKERNKLRTPRTPPPPSYLFLKVIQDFSSNYFKKNCKWDRPEIMLKKMHLQLSRYT